MRMRMHWLLRVHVRLQALLSMRMSVRLHMPLCSACMDMCVQQHQQQKRYGRAGTVPNPVKRQSNSSVHSKTKQS